MPDTGEDFIILILAFASTVLFIEAVYFVWNASRNSGSARTKRRLKAVARGKESTQHKTQAMSLDKLSADRGVYAILPSLKRLRHALERAAPDTSPGVLALYTLTIAVVVFVALLLFADFSLKASIFFTVLVAFVGPALFISYRARKYKETFNEQLPDAMDYMARALRAGHPFTASLKSLSEDMSEPLATEFGIVFDEIKYGMDAEIALQNLIDRTESEEIRFFVTAVMVNRTTGGNLAKILERLSTVMRARATTRREITVLSTEMRYSANVLIALPFLVAGGISLFQPDYFGAFLASNTGRALVLMQLGFIAVGYFIIRRMVNLRI